MLRASLHNLRRSAVTALAARQVDSSLLTISSNPQNSPRASSAGGAVAVIATLAGITALSLNSRENTRRSALCEQVAFSSLRRHQNPGLDLTGKATHCDKGVPGPRGLPSRSDQIQSLKSTTPSTPYDILVIGGGATGAGVALDAATRHLSSPFDNSKQLKVGCIERGDFASETSSRSTKLIWAGIKYLATASAALISQRLLTHPIDTVQDFMGEFQMVRNCHRERRYMTHKQRHLTNWVPIAIPFTEWHLSPPPFDHWLFGFFPILAPFVLKFYDGMSGFTCPSSYVMGKKRSMETFPQLSDKSIKYCAVFFEAQHDDARTNLSIAMSAAEHGAHIANYVEMVGVVREGDDVEMPTKKKKVVGIKAVDRMSNEKFVIYANKVVFAGGPFTDAMRQIEFDDNGTALNESKEGDQGGGDKFKPAVSGASGTHIVLPGYYSPNNMGLLDFNTSDGRFLFFLPWQNHTLVGTTDTKGPAETLPSPPEDEVQWLLNECGKYLSDDLRVRRSDVLSAWRGWRPLAVDPHAEPGAPVSRSHIISEDPESGIIFIAGGKWTTWREMAEETVDRVLGKDGPKSTTLDLTLFGGEGYSANLAIKLIQKYGMSQETAQHLAKTYGGRAWDVCELSQSTQLAWPRFGIPLAPNYPYIDAEVVYACREYACTIEDVLSRRTRLAFLNKDAALAALPVVADIMAKELGWSKSVKKEQIAAAKQYVESYAGRVPNKKEATLRHATYRDIKDVFNAIDSDGNGYLDVQEIGEVATALGFPLDEKELRKAFSQMDKKKNGRVDMKEFEEWWNQQKDSEFHKKLCKELSLGGQIKDMGHGTFLG